MTPTTTSSSGDAFEQVVQSARAIKKEFVDPRLAWYDSHSKIPRYMFRVTGIALIILSVCLPAMAALEFPGKKYWLSGVSVLIAALTGISSFYRWERTWSGNSFALVSLQQYVAKWELEITHARLILPDAERVKHVYKATDDLLTNTRSVVASESEGFFSALQSAQQSTSKNS